ncbi:MAG: tRNA (adenosine(37)-N6)-threonylcarbamoyltransferase complex dimerization subunit type 1 TsaB [Acidobacteriia bacterium]|nr:tRNA (adenosine(37)-N6)-threonylcarbamoyltransferase complex dimerization subunit type 1 TsaB [Terriglobia bacterium]
MSRKLLLAIDTTSEFGSIALAEDGRVLEEVAMHSPDGFAHVMFPEIEALLARHHVKITDIEGFAAAAGPGSFTGVRVGLTAAKGLAEATGRKVVAVSNLQAVASFGTRALRAPVIDARRGDIFGAVYDADLRLVAPEVVMKLDDWLQTLPAGTEVIDHPPKHLAGAIARIAAGQFEAGLAQDPAEIDANYVRRSDAELMWRDKV